MHEDPELARLQLAFDGRYRIERSLGSGGMATVYRAEDLKHHRPVAIKVLRPGLAAALGPERFAREVDVAARLNHPHIVALIDSGEAKTFLYYVMPIVEGESLRARIKRQNQLPVEQALRIIEQIAAALDYAHRQGVVHRDIKPENILLHHDEALLADFGIALVQQSVDGDRLTETGIGVGTPGYMSPEQAAGDQDLDARSDVYSLACVLYELLTGEPPFAGPNARAVLAKSLTEPAPSSRRVRESIPEAVDRALQRAMAKDAADRFPTTEEFARALRSGHVPVSTLPAQPSGLVGRQREVAEAAELLRSWRLVTLTGPGGSGKTRLAIQIASHVAGEFPDGVFWVPLQAIRDAKLVEPAINASLRIDGVLADEIGKRRLLILLDNFEQVVDAAPAISSLLHATPNCRLLITSREPLFLDAEHRYPVDPLPEEDAAALFTQRARALVPGFSSTSAVRDICRRLDGLPLAIELAAARVSLLEPEELLARLDRRLPLLTSMSRDAPARQRTLRSAIGWSFELLNASEQDLFRRLGVFAGSFSLDAAESVCDADLDALESLVVKSLVRRWGGGRFGMLETICEYALELLEGSPDAAAVHERHARYFLDVARSANLNAGTIARGGMRVDIGVREQDNIRAAIDWAIATSRIELGLELATAMEMIWVVQNTGEGSRLFSALFDRPEAAHTSPTTRAHALRAYGSTTDIGGNDALARDLYERSLALFEELGDELGRAVLLHRLGIQAMRRGELAVARAHVEASHEIHTRLVNLWGQTQTTGTLGAIARDEGDAEAAQTWLKRSIALARETGGFQWWEGGMLAEFAMLALHGERIDEAERYALDALAIADGFRDRPARVLNVGILAAVAAARGHAELAGRLWGAIEGENPGAPLGGWRRHKDACAQRVRRVAGREFDRGCAAGRAGTLDDAVSILLQRE